MTLHVWQLGPDQIIARSGEDCFAVELEECGVGRDEFDGDTPNQIDDDETLSISWDVHDLKWRGDWWKPYVEAEDLEEGDGHLQVRAPCKVWIEHMGRGILSSEEY